MNQGKVRYAVTQMQSPMDQQTEAEVNRLLYSILMLEQSYDEARKILIYIYLLNNGFVFTSIVIYSEIRVGNNIGYKNLLCKDKNDPL